MDKWEMNKRKDGRADKWLDEWLINVDEWKEEKQENWSHEFEYGFFQDELTESASDGTNSSNKPLT
jgi:hypothetical protein